MPEEPSAFRGQIISVSFFFLAVPLISIWIFIWFYQWSAWNTTNDPTLAKCLSFFVSITNAQMFLELSLRCTASKSSVGWVCRLLDLIHCLSTSFSFRCLPLPPQPKFICGHTDLLHKIKRKALELHWIPSMKLDEWWCRVSLKHLTRCHGRGCAWFTMLLAHISFSSRTLLKLFKFVRSGEYDWRNCSDSCRYDGNALPASRSNVHP